MTMTKQTWRCPHCKCTFTNVDALLRHINTKHPNAPRRNR